MNDDLNLNATRESDAPASEAVTTSRRTALSKTLPTNRLTFQKQVDIIRAYGAAYDAAKAPVGIEDISSFVKMAPATVSQTNGFLTEVGLVRKEGRRFVPAAELQAMSRLYDVSRDKALTKLAPLFERSWFGAFAMPKVRFKPMKEEDLVHELFEEATAESQHLPQVRMLVDYLVLVGLLERDGGMLKVKNGQTEEGQSQAVPLAPAQPPVTEKVATAAAVETPEAVLLLNADGSRRFTVKAPPTIKRQELARIQKWLEFQLIVEDEPGPQAGAGA